MNSLSRFLTTLALVTAALAPRLASADVVMPPPTNCPRGQTGITSHGGPQCVLDAPTDCPTGWIGQLGGHCMLRPCLNDAGCGDGQACVEHAVCLHPFEDPFYDYGEEEREKHGRLDLPEDPETPMLQSPALLAGPKPPKMPRPKPIVRYDAVNLCSGEVACTAPNTCQPEKVCVPKGKRALAYRGANVHGARVARKTETPIPTSAVDAKEATAAEQPRPLQGCGGCAVIGDDRPGAWMWGVAAIALAGLRRRRARALLQALFAAALLSLLCGCNVVAMQQARMESGMRAAGLTPKDQKLGADTVRYWSGGQGPAVVLIHGFGGSATWLWHPQVNDLVKDHRVILPDLLWFGDSRSEARDFSIDHQVRAVEALLDHLGEREADVVGVSYGGLVAHELASDRVQAVRRLVLVDSPGRVYTRDDYNMLCRRMTVAHLGEVLVPKDPSGVERILGLAYFDPPWLPDFALSQTLAAMYSSYREERTALLDSLLDNMDALKARKATLQARTMVVWGRQDPVFPLEVGERLATSLHAPIRVLEKARHAPNLEHPEEFNRILRGFLAGG